MRQAALGRDHPDVARDLDALAALYRQDGRFEQASSAATRALAILRATRCGAEPGPDARRAPDR